MADLDLSDGLYLTLLRYGWIVAMSSYRRQGRIVKGTIATIPFLLTPSRCHARC